jgi:hypothetical protein
MSNSIRWFGALLAALLVPAIASAAVDFYLKIEGVNGEARVVHCPNGACVVSDLAPGQYTVLVCDAQGAVIPTDLTLRTAIVSPRDAASGRPTGRRTHQPLTITKPAGRAGATAAATNTIAIDEPGVHLAIGVSDDAVDAAVAQTTKATKSRSNIQNN